MAERSLAGASIVVTGASGGLGGFIARQLADYGARLTLVARDVSKVESLGIDATLVSADLRDAETSRRIVAAAVGAHDRLDGLVNAAGVVAFGPLVDTDDEVIEDLFLTNVLGPLWLMRAAIPALTAADRALARELRAAGIGVTDARPPHTETGLADRPISGTAPRLKEGLQPDVVARRIVAAIIAGEREIPADAFSA